MGSLAIGFDRDLLVTTEKQKGARKRVRTVKVRDGKANAAI